MTEPMTAPDALLREALHHPNFLALREALEDIAFEAQAWYESVWTGADPKEQTLAESVERYRAALSATPPASADVSPFDVAYRQGYDAGYKNGVADTTPPASADPCLDPQLDPQLMPPRAGDAP